jgi:hypothetical protein
MDPRSSRATGWQTFAAVVLVIGGFFAMIDGLVAVNKARFFSANAVYVFSNLNTWGWIIFGLGVAGIVSGIAVFSGSQWARWLGIAVAAVSALGQLMFAQAYPLWSLMIMAIDFLVIYGLVVYGGRESVAAMTGYSEDTGRAPGTSEIGAVDDERRRAA